MCFASSATEPCYLRSERSPAFARFCERLYGRMLNQYGTADMEQIELLIRVLRLGSEHHVLDAGCGTGATTAYLAEHTGARFTGIDTAEAAIARARERAAGSDRLSFVMGNMDALDFPVGSFDAVIAIESLYFPKDLAVTIGHFKTLLRTFGQMGLFYTDFNQAGTRCAPESTKLGRALAENAISFEAHDLTDSDRRFWQRAKEVAEVLTPEFEAEGNADLMHMGETTAVLDLIAKGGHARYLYHAVVR